MLGNLTGWHVVIIFGIILVLFGATKLPSLARGLGQSAKIFRSEVNSDEPGADATSTFLADETVFLSHKTKA